MLGDYFHESLERKKHLNTLFSLSIVTLRFVFLVALLNLFPPTAVGEFFFYRSAFYLLAAFLIAPFNQILTRYIPLNVGNGERQRTISTFAVLSSIAFSLLIAALLYLLTSRWEVLAIALGAAIYYLYYSYVSAWNQIYIRAFLLPAVWLLFTLSLFVIPKTLPALSLAYLLSNAILLPPFLWDVARKTSFEAVNARELLSYGIAASLTNQRNYAFNALDSFAIGLFLSPNAVATYTAVVDSLRRIANGLLKPLSLTLQTHLGVVEKGQRLPLIMAELKRLLILSVALSLLALPLLPSFYALLFPAYAQHWSLAVPYLMAVGGMALTYMLEAYLKIEGRRKLLAKVSLAGAFLNAALTFLLTPILGLWGPVLGTALAWWTMGLTYWLSLPKGRGGRG